ncbi:hypothetical protein TRICI_004341 [Trichomonascus ciferrii]|uniref:Zinc finger PHD-type domain-containing protein n=1 Tax=Trichomonascus ciferrii TaxID=44093 RepID=A0A642V1E2_9ASCO|nr:hypothetical protein TRICI_004341 [Trichomonascus ciferrii]
MAQRRSSRRGESGGRRGGRGGRRRGEDEEEAAAATIEEEEEEDEEDEAGDSNDEEDGGANEVTRCICGHQELQSHAIKSSLSSIDTGLFIQCDECHVWQHGFCVGFKQEEDVPDVYYCERCRPERHLVVVRPTGRTSTYYPRGIPKEQREEYNHLASTTAPATRRSAARDKSATPRSADEGLNSGSSTATATATSRREQHHRRRTLNSRDAEYEETLKRVLEESKDDGARPVAAENGVKREADGDEGPPDPAPPKAEDEGEGDVEMQDADTNDNDNDTNNSNNNEDENGMGSRSRSKSKGKGKGRNGDGRDKAEAEEEQTNDNDNDDNNNNSNNNENGSRKEENDDDDTTATGSKRTSATPKPARKTSDEEERSTPRGQAGGRKRQRRGKNSTQPSTNNNNSSSTTNKGKKNASNNNNATTSSKPRIPAPRTGLPELRKRVAAILEFMTRTKADLHAEREDRNALLAQRYERYESLHGTATKERERHFGLFEMYDQNLQALEEVTTKLVAWENAYGSYNPDNE